MESIAIYISNFLQLLLVSSLFLLFGWLLNDRKPPTFRAAFMSLFVGVIGLSTAFAIFKTGGKTFYCLLCFGRIENRNL